jgi:hypothetical protein
MVGIVTDPLGDANKNNMLWLEPKPVSAMCPPDVPGKPLARPQGRRLGLAAAYDHSLLTVVGALMATQLR